MKTFQSFSKSESILQEAKSERIYKDLHKLDTKILMALLKIKDVKAVDSATRDLNMKIYAEVIGELARRGETNFG